MRNGQKNCLWPRWAANFVSWESIKPTNGLSLNFYLTPTNDTNLHKSYTRYACAAIQMAL